MSNLTTALQQLRAERQQAQLQIEKLASAFLYWNNWSGETAPHQHAPGHRAVALFRLLHGAKWRQRKERDGRGSVEAKNLSLEQKKAA